MNIQPKQKNVIITEEVIPIKNIEKIDIDNEKLLIKKEEFLLKVLNIVLLEIGRDKINNILDFVNVNNDTVSSKNNIITEELLNEAISIFGKRDCGYYDKDKGKRFILTFIKKMARNLNYKIITTKGYTNCIVDNILYKKSVGFTSITK